MPAHPLLNEHTITIPSALAATIGLERAVLLTVLNDAAQAQTSSQTRISSSVLCQQLAFWSPSHIQQLLLDLEAQGLIRVCSPWSPQTTYLTFSFSEEHESYASTQLAFMPDTTASTTHAATNGRYAQHPLPRQHWQPSSDTLTRLEQHGINRAFALHQLDAFLLKVGEQRGRPQDLNHRFFSYVKQQWVYAQQDAQPRSQGAFERQTFQIQPDEAKPMAANWQPSMDAIDILQKGGVEGQFIQDAVPEFVLYWAERGDAHKTWSSKFVQHVRQQWARYRSSVEHSTQPKRICDDWQPSDDCYDILALAHIDRQFAQDLVPEFVLYWRESNQLHTSWNSRFLEYCKQKWSRRLNVAQPGNTHESGSDQSGYATASASLERLQDTSWADG